MLARYIASDKNFGILNGLFVPNMEAGEVFPKNETMSLHDVHRSGSPVRLGVVDCVGFRHQSSGGFPNTLSETNFSRAVAGYD